MPLVRNLRTGEEIHFSCPPRQAVVAAHAQERGDFNTWDYEEKYEAQESRLCFVCGDWAAFKQSREVAPREKRS